MIVTGFDFGSQRWGGYAELTRSAGRMGRAAADGNVSARSDGVGHGRLHRGPMRDGARTRADRTVDRTDRRHRRERRRGLPGCGAACAARLSRHRDIGQTGCARMVDASRRCRNLAGEAIHDDSGKPLLPTRWAGVVDTVGGVTLQTLIRSTQLRGCVTACGLVGGVELPLTVYPFILRGVRLVGIDSAWLPQPDRSALWKRLAGPWRLANIGGIVHEIELADVPAAAGEMLAGKTWGRTLVRVAGS